MTLQFPIACFVGLVSAGTEVAVAGYVRQPAVLAYCEDGVTIANTASLQWQHATASWGVIDLVRLYDAATGGTLLGTMPVLVPVEIRQYDIARIPAAGILAVYQPVTRRFGTGKYGDRPYGPLPRLFADASAVVVRGFDNQHVCAPGTWAPGPFSLAA